MAFAAPSNGQPPDPWTVYADSAALTSLLRNIMIIAVSILSDMVFVSTAANPSSACSSYHGATQGLRRVEHEHIYHHTALHVTSWCHR